MAWTLISSLNSPTSGAFDFPSLSLGAYSVMQVFLSGITVTTDGTDVQMTFYVGGSEIVTGYRWAINSISSAAAGLNDGDASDPAIWLTSNDANWDVGNDATESFGAVIQVDNLNSTSLYKTVQFNCWAINPAGNSLAMSGGGVMENAGAIGGLKIKATSNLVAGKVRILGL